jgi:hypothetical protein
MRLANLTNKFFLICAVILFLTISTQTFASEFKDGPIARQKLIEDVRLLLHQEKYDELENLANTLRKTKARFPDGGWKIGSFYDAFANPYYGWDELFRNLNTWRTKYPNSLTARIALSESLHAYAWAARGSGYANTVGEQGWKLMRERIAKAYDLIKDDPVKPNVDCPYRYHLLLRTANAQAWDRNRYEALFQKAVSFEPSFWGYYTAKAYYLLPRWHGEEGEWQKFADKAEQTTSQRKGMGIYARIIIDMWHMNEFKAFKEPEISWRKTKNGFLDIQNKYPKSPYMLNWFCMMACIADDKETARSLFKKIGDNPYTEVWNGRSNYEKWKRWAGV